MGFLMIGLAQLESLNVRERESHEMSARETLADLTIKKSRKDNPIPELRLTAEEQDEIYFHCQKFGLDYIEHTCNVLIAKRATWMREHFPHPLTPHSTDGMQGRGILRIAGLDKRRKPGVEKDI